MFVNIDRNNHNNKIMAPKAKTQKTDTQKEKERLKEQENKLKEDKRRLKEEEKKKKEETKMLKDNEKLRKDIEQKEKRKEEEQDRLKIIEEHKKKQIKKNTYIPILEVLGEYETIKKIIHIGDIHIRLSERHVEYNRVFEEFYKCLYRIKEQEPNTLVCLCGDLLEKKDNLKPDTVIHTWNFLKNISDIFPLIIIAGNHDVIETNLDKNDSISSILQDRPLSNIYYLRNTGVYIYSNIIFGVSSVIDKHVLTRIELDSIMNSNSSELNIFKNYKSEEIKTICLYHGPLIDAMTNLNHIIKNDDEMIIKYLKLCDFGRYDYYMLGDIHKFQYLNETKTAAYCSSMISQNYTETDNEHGYLEWNILKTPEFVQFPSTNVLGNLHNTSKYTILPNEHRHYKLDVNSITTCQEIDDLKLIDALTNIKSGNMELRYLSSDYKLDINGIMKKILSIRPNLIVKLKAVSDHNVQKRIFLNKLKTKEIIKNQITELFDDPTIKTSETLETVDSDTNIEITYEGSKDPSSVIPSNTTERSNDHSFVRAEIQQNQLNEDNKVKIDMNISDEYVSHLVDMYLNENYKELPEDMNKLIKDKLNEKITRIENSSEYSEYDWRILYLEFENMYGYGYNNVFDFTKYSNNDMIGIFGQNGLGKSAFIDIITFMLYCRSARNKNVIIPKDIINVASDTSYGNLIIESDEKKYLISRYCRRDATRNNAVKVETSLFELRLYDESKSNIPKSKLMNFLGKTYQKYCLTEEQRKYTDKVIDKIVGSYDSFLMTSILLQGNAKTFKEMDRADKKKRLYEILKIDHFENANNQITEERKILRKHLKEKETTIKTSNINLEEFNHNINQLKTEIIPTLYLELEKEQNSQTILSDEISEIIQQIIPLNKSFAINIISDDKDLDKIKIKRINLQNNILQINNNIDKIQSDISENNKQINKLKYLEQSDQIIHNHNIYQENLKLKQKTVLEDINTLNKSKQTLKLIQTKYQSISNVEDEEQILNDKLNEISDKQTQLVNDTKKYQKQIKSLKLVSKSDSISQSNTDYKNQQRTLYNHLSDCISELKQSNTILQSQITLSNKSNEELNLELSELNDCNENIQTYIKSDKTQKYLKSENKIKSDYEHLMRSSTDFVYEKLNNMKSLNIKDKEILNSEIDEIIDTLNIILNKTVQIKHSTIQKYDKLIIFKTKYDDQNTKLEENNKQILNINDLLNTNNQNSILESKIAKNNQELSKLEVQHKESAKDIPNLQEYDELLSELEIQTDINKRLSDINLQKERLNIEHQKLSDQFEILETEISNIKINEKTQLQINSLDKKIQTKQTELDKLNDTNDQTVINYQRLKEEEQINDKLSKTNIFEYNQILKEQQTKHKIEVEIKNIDDDIFNYETNRFSILTNNQIQSSVNIKKLEIKDINQKIKILNDQIIKTESECNKLENQKSQYELQYSEYLRLKTETKISEYLHEITGPNGIALYILKNRLDDFTKMINTILKPFIDKRIELQIVSDGVEMIIHTSDNHIIYTIGGMESLMLDFTFKIIVGQLSIMPKCNLLFIDESISVLDKERLDHIDDIFTFLKQYYSNVFLITHIEEVKYKMDSQITIYQINGRTIIRNIDGLCYLNLTNDVDNDIYEITSERSKNNINNNNELNDKLYDNIMQTSKSKNTKITNTKQKK